MRGVVSLAAAQTLPLQTPYRSLLQVCTIAVIIGTLVLQGLSLPWVIRRLGIVEDHRADDMRERAEAHTRTNAAINDRVDELCAAGQLSDRQAELMRKWAALRDWRNWDDDDRSRDFGARLSVLSDWRRSLLGIERSVIVSMRDGGELTEDVLREMQHDLDLEEALLERRSDAVDGHLQELPAAGIDRDQVDPTGDSETGRAGDHRVADDQVGDDNVGDGNVGDGNVGDGNVGDAGLDRDAAIDDAEVSALLTDEQSADGAGVGKRAGKPAG
jgi:CPA1 family monovalent cation:H+ antiporter